MPAIIDDHITGALEPLFATEPALAAALAADTACEAVEHWAIHPGGRSILDKVESRLGSPRRSSCRRARRCTTSATCRAPRCCSCCKHILESEAAVDGDRVAAMAFGPGLTVESALLTVRA